jgi:hypothetical protein
VLASLKAGITAQSDRSGLRIFICTSYVLVAQLASMPWIS